MKAPLLPRHSADFLQMAAGLALAATRLIYPPQCLACGALTGSDFALCGACWRDTPFITGSCCQRCGLPLATPGPAPGAEEEEDLLCEDCHVAPPPWARGRAALLYGGTARRLILAFKHGDRPDLARPMARWMARAGQRLLEADPLILPVPLHRLRLFRRRYNQAALLARALAADTGLACCPDALIRPRSTPSLEGKSREARFACLEGAILATPRGRARIRGRVVVLVDDVMTSGATLTAAALACHAAGADQVCILPLARVAKET